MIKDKYYGWKEMEVSSRLHFIDVVLSCAVIFFGSIYLHAEGLQAGNSIFFHLIVSYIMVDAFTSVYKHIMWWFFNRGLDAHKDK